MADTSLVPSEAAPEKLCWCFLGFITQSWALPAQALVTQRCALEGDELLCPCGRRILVWEQRLPGLCWDQGVDELCGIHH